MTVLGLGAAGVAADDGQTLGDIIGVPVMPGMEEVADSRLLFDKPDGRIVETFLVGQVGMETARQFYEDTLGPLGWLRLRGAGIPDDVLRFERGRERLTLDFHREQDGSLIIRVNLTPTP